MPSTRITPHRRQVLSDDAARMRRAPTASEHALFLALRGKRLGVSFKRQVPLLGRFIVDLYASKARLVVEVDGSAHDARVRQDAVRDRALRRGGYHVLRVSADLVMRDVEAAVELVRAAVEAPSA